MSYPHRRPLLHLPLVLYLLAFFAYPASYAIKLAFTDPLRSHFPSLVNFREILDDRLFWSALANNLLLPLLSVTLEVVVGLALALLFSRRFPGRSALRTMVVLPFALPEIVFLTAMRYVFARHGYANGALQSLGVAPIEWLAPGTLTAQLTVVAVDAWHVTPVVFLILLAALTAIPDDLLHAAEIDGAGELQRFWFVILPLLRPALFAAVMLRGVDALRMFATPLVLTGVEGVPVLSSYAYHQWSDYGSDGAAAAASVLLAILSVLLAVPLLRRRAA